MVAFIGRLSGGDVEEYSVYGVGVSCREAIHSPGYL